ncbi:hypothetical protein EOD04_18530, partial [Mesorhizobium sp. M2C.T.Ca.TU.009.01.2.1]
LRGVPDDQQQAVIERERTALKRDAPSSGCCAATFSPVGRRGWCRRRQPPLPSGERSAERSGGWVRGRATYCAEGSSASPSSVNGEALGTHCTAQPCGVGCF